MCVHKILVHSKNAPAPVGAYSQAIKCGHLVFISGQLPLSADTMEIVDGGFEERARQVFRNLLAVAEAAGGSFEQVVKLTVYLTDLGTFAVVNRVMAEYFSEPYPARAVLGVVSLPKSVDIEVEAVLSLSGGK